MFIQQQNIIDKRTRLKFFQGRIVATDDSNDWADLVDDSNVFITSEPILGGQHFYLRVKEGYKVAFVVFFDRATHKRIRYTTNADSWNNISGSSLASNIRDTLSGPGRVETNLRTFIPADAYVRVTVCNADAAIADGVASGTAVSPSDDVVDAFYLFDTVFTPRRNDYAKPDCYAMAMLLARQVNAAYTQAAAATKNTDGWIGYGTDNSICMGVPYVAVSGQRRGSMSLGFPSMETYLSLWANRRSLLYTECPKSHTSGYGLSWSLNSPMQSYGRMPYGMVCNSAAATLFGMPEMTDEDIWAIASGDNRNFFSYVYGSANSTDAESQMLADNAAKLRSLDVCYTAGNHVFVITDVFDINGERFIEVFESSSNCQLYIITPQQLYYRLNNQRTQKGRNFKFVRPKQAFYDLVGRYSFTPTDGTPTTPRQRSHYTPNLDICTFIGDKVTIAKGDTLWLNVRKSNGTTAATFDTVRLYRLVNGSYSRVDSSAMSTTSEHKKTMADGDVVWDIDITAKVTTPGLYKATAYNSNTQVESEPTFFEVLDIGISAAWRLTYSGGLIVRLSEGDAAGRQGFVEALQPDYTVVRDNTLTYAHHLVHGHEEGKYGMVLAKPSFDLSPSGSKAFLAVKGTYGYAQSILDIDSTAVSNLLATSLSSVTRYNNYALYADGPVKSGVSGFATTLRAVAASEVGKRYSILFNDMVKPTTWAMRVSQYSCDPSNIANLTKATLLKTHILKSTQEEPTGETRCVDVEIAEGCTCLAVSTVVFNTLPLINTMVQLPYDRTLDRDKGFDYYIGYMPFCPESSVLQDMSVASLLTHAKGYKVAQVPSYVRDISADDIYRESANQMLYIIWTDDHPPQSGSQTGSIGSTYWNTPAAFQGSGANAWDTNSDKLVTIGSKTYHVSSYFGNFDEGDRFTLNF